ncbi:MAG: HAD-IA family hydrolase [Thalassolituus sp.]
MKYELIIFDWDGTLADSTRRIVDSMARAAAECGLPAVDDADIQNIIGLGLPEAIKTVWPAVTDEQMKPMKAVYGRYFVSDSNVPAGLFAGARSMLESLGTQRKLAVATGKSRKGLNRILADLSLEDCFDATRCADETASKPNPLMLEQILSVLGVEPSAALMVGDTTYDLDMARNIGMDTIGMSHGAHEEDRLCACGALAICHSIQQLKDWIEHNG